MNPLEQPEFCVICGERVNPFEDAAEMYDPESLATALLLGKEYSDLTAREAGIVHGECGAMHGWEIS